MGRMFPMFVDLTDRKILVYGAGTIAARRIRTLLMFGADILVIAPSLDTYIEEKYQSGSIRVEKREYCEGEIGDDYYFVLACTDRPSVNESIFRECRKKGIMVNACHDQSLCDFQFPAVALKDDVVIGINSGGSDHSKVREVRQAVEKLI